MPHILDPKQLKENVKRLHTAHCTSEPPAESAGDKSPAMGPSDDSQR